VSGLNETKPATASPCLNAATVTAVDGPNWKLCGDQRYMTVSTGGSPDGIQTDCEKMGETIELSRQYLRENYFVEKNIGADL
jgi:hypothetical protein